ncbi:MAG: 30S ribosomal protein S18 [Candidatus Omnitrophica bacterium]|nr:30S ribosomal protein S18 [Candidatus Omnitrophota bacterium]
MRMKTSARTGRARTGGRKREVLTRKKFCRFCQDKTRTIDYKDLKRLEYFITERGKILSSRISGNCAKHQRSVSEAIKKARFISLLPYTR